MNSPFCFKNHKTGQTITIWDYFQSKHGTTQQETLVGLARMANYPLPDLTGYSGEKEEMAREKSKGFETALAFFKDQLWKDEGKEALHYLMRKRKYTEYEIKRMEQPRNTLSRKLKSRPSTQFTFRCLFIMG